MCIRDRNIPLDEVPYRVNEIAALPSPRVLYCRSGNRSGIAVQMLRQAGLGDLHNGGGLYDMEIMLAGRQVRGQYLSLIHISEPTRPN